MGKRHFLFVILLIFSTIGFSQENQGDSIVPKSVAKSPQKPIDSTFVTYYSASFDSIFLNAPKVIDTATFNANDFDVLSRDRTIYSTLCNTGYAHKSMRFAYSDKVGFNMELPSYSAFVKTKEKMESYVSVLPYSEARYVMTIGNKEQHLNVKFGRQFARRLYISFAFNTEVSPGVFQRCQTNNNYFWINAHYTTENQRYGIMAYWYRNKMDMQENGGIVRDDDFISHTESDFNVININLAKASNYVKVSGAGFEHYFNLLSSSVNVKRESDSTQVSDSLFITDSIMMDSTVVDSIVTDSIMMDSIALDSIQTVKDSIQPTAQNEQIETVARKFTLGRISHKFDYQRNQLFFNETSPSASFYQPFAIDTLLFPSMTTDTTIVQAITNKLNWNSLGYQKYNDDVPFFVFAGIEQGIYKIKHYDYIEGEMGPERNFNQFGINGGIIINLFKSTRVSGKAKLITLGYQIGDFDLNGEWRQYLGTYDKNIGKLIFNIDVKRQSANWFEESYTSNHFRWENDFNAATYLSFGGAYQYKAFNVGVKQTTVNNLIYFGLQARPEQLDDFCSISEAFGSFHFTLRRFEFDGFASLQKASNEEVIHLPLFLGKIKFSYSQPIFNKAATLQPNITVQYFTKYYADAYMPALRTFHLQNEVKIGDFPFIDLALAIKVKRANVYVSYTNMFLLTGNYDAFIAPHYPMRGSRFFIGINWRLFN